MLVFLFLSILGNGRARVPHQIARLGECGVRASLLGGTLSGAYSKLRFLRDEPVSPLCSLASLLFACSSAVMKLTPSSAGSNAWQGRASKKTRSLKRRPRVRMIVQEGVNQTLAQPVQRSVDVFTPIGGTLYSLLHLAGFPGDLSFYSKHATGAVLELGCGDGRVAAALIAGKVEDSVVQRYEPDDPRYGSEDSGERKLQIGANISKYLGIEWVESLAHKAQEKISSNGVANVIIGDFLNGAVPENVSFDTVILSANTLFSNPRHSDVLELCSQALRPGGFLLFDVYNAIFWHMIEYDVGDDDDDASTGSEEDFLVRIGDEKGRDWMVYERDPIVERSNQTIECQYRFDLSAQTGGPRNFTQCLVHHYSLPEQLLSLLEKNFEVESVYGDFFDSPFEADDSEHFVVVARKRLQASSVT